MGKIRLALIVVWCYMVLAQAVLAAEPQVSARAALLLDADTGRVLWQQQGYAPQPPASTTKILTTLLCIDLADLQREVEVSPRAAAVGESSAGLLAGERFRLGELLDAALLKSANDACYAIAEGVVGSEPYFVRLMNAKAHALGAWTAKLANTNGLPDDSHLMSCYDLALLARAAMTREAFASRVGSRSATMEGGSYNRSLKNTNKLLTMDEAVTGIKTGTTNAAGACLVSSMTKLYNGQERNVIAVVLHSSDRYNDSLRLLNFGVEEFANRRLVQAGQPLVYLPLADCREPGVWLVAEGDCWATLAEGEQLAYTYHLKQPVAGVTAGELLGTLEFAAADGGTLCRVNLLAAEAVDSLPGWRQRLEQTLRLLFGD